MLKKSKTMNVNGSSIVTVNEKEMVVSTMNASIGENGAININKYIQNKEAYLENKEQVEKDAAEFESYVLQLAEV